MHGEAIATLEDGMVEAAVFAASYGFLVVVRNLVVDHVLGTKPFRNLADAMAYAELLTKRPALHLPAAEYHSQQSAHWGLGPAPGRRSARVPPRSRDQP